MIKDPYMDTLINFTPNAGISKKKKNMKIDFSE